MFSGLKDKLKSWISKTKDKIVGTEKPSKPVKTKAKSKPKVKTKPKKSVKEERKVTEKIVEDIKKENLEISSPEEKFEKQGFFKKLFSSKFTLQKEDFDEIFSELELVLLENNVAYEVVEKIKKDIEIQLVGKEIDKKNLEEEIKNSLKESILKIIQEPFDLVEKIKNFKESRPFVIVLFGINGSGKTTTIAKIAKLLLKNKISLVLGAADTFRAASIEQLSEHGKKLGVEVIKSQYNSDPASVAFDAIKHATSKNIKVVLIDTAGRMHTKDSLMKEMEKIIRISKPDLKIFIGESITGNDATLQAKTFNEAIGIDGIILSKADVDDKGGTALSVSYVTGKPILYFGIGQEYENLEKFSKEKMLERLGL